MVLIALVLVAASLFGWLVVDAVRNDHHRHAPEEERWHAAFDRILAAPLPPGVDGTQGVDGRRAAGPPDGPAEPSERAPRHLLEPPV